MVSGIAFAISSSSTPWAKVAGARYMSSRPPVVVANVDDFEPRFASILYLSWASSMGDLVDAPLGVSHERLEQGRCSADQIASRVALARRRIA
jgi:hypothetical protein